LYELTLRYPNANFASELIYFNVEQNVCIVKVHLYLGASYELSDKKAEAMKSGPLSSLDKVETAAKARAARDFGISVEYALEMDTEEDALAIPPARSSQPQGGSGTRQTPPRSVSKAG
jgi:hypothetical protein